MRLLLASYDDGDRAGGGGEGGSVSSAVISWVCCGCALVTLLQLFLLFKEHFDRMHAPAFQSLFLRVASMVQVNAVFAAVAQFFPHYNDLFFVIPGAYEGFAMDAFVCMLVRFCGGEEKAGAAIARRHRSQDPTGKSAAALLRCNCCLCCTVPFLRFRDTVDSLRCLRLRVQQYMFVKPACLLCSGILKSAFDTDQPCGGSASDDCPRWLCLVAVIVGVIQALSVFCAIRAMKDTYSLLGPDIPSLRAGTKFLCVYLIMMLTVIQVIGLFYLITYNYITLSNVPFLGVNQQQTAPYADRFISRLLCVELPFVAYAFSRAFSLQGLPALLEASENLRASFNNVVGGDSGSDDDGCGGGGGLTANLLAVASIGDGEVIMNDDSAASRGSSSARSWRSSGNYWRFPRSSSTPAAPPSYSQLPVADGITSNQDIPPPQHTGASPERIWISGDYETGYALDEATGLPKLSKSEKLAMVYSFPTPQKPSVLAGWNAARSEARSEAHVSDESEGASSARGRGRSVSADNIDARRVRVSDR